MKLTLNKLLFFLALLEAGKLAAIAYGEWLPIVVATITQIAYIAIYLTVERTKRQLNKLETVLKSPCHFSQ